MVSIPDRLNVEVVRCTGDLQVRLARLRSDWHINLSRGSVDASLQEPGDTRLQVEIRDGGVVQGNVAWDSVAENEAGLTTEAGKTWGSGTYALVIRQVDGSPLIRIQE